MMTKKAFLRRLKRELHWTKLIFRDRNWRNISFSPWLPYNLWQLLYIGYRWIIALYFFGWFIVVFVDAQPKTLIFLTIWGFITYVAYLLIAAVSCTVKLILNWKTVRNGDYLIEEGVKIGVTWSEDELSWYQKVHWVMFQMALLIQLGILILYWALLFENDNPMTKYHPANFHVHLLGGIMSLVDVGVSGVIISIYHIYIGMIYGSVYSIFSGIYYAAGGKGINGTDYIYPVLDYSTNPGQAVGLDFIVLLVLLPAMHCSIYAFSLLRRWAVYHFRRHCYKGSRPETLALPGNKDWQTYKSLLHN